MQREIQPLAFIGEWRMPLVDNSEAMRAFVGTARKHVFDMRQRQARHNVSGPISVVVFRGAENKLELEGLAARLATSSGILPPKHHNPGDIVSRVKGDRIDFYAIEKPVVVVHDARLLDEIERAQLVSGDVSKQLKLLVIATSKTPEGYVLEIPESVCPPVIWPDRISRRLADIAPLIEGVVTRAAAQNEWPTPAIAQSFHQAMRSPGINEAFRGTIDLAACVMQAMDRWSKTLVKGRATPQLTGDHLIGLEYQAASRPRQQAPRVNAVGGDAE